MPPHGDGEAPQRFYYHRGIAPMVWALVAIAVVELAVVHLLVALLWNGLAALVLSLVTVTGLAWLVALILSMRRLPVLLDGQMLLMRVGTFRQARVPLSDIAGVRTSVDAGIRRAPNVLKLSLLAHPNIVVDLRRPLPGRWGEMAIAHRLDDPAAFAGALERLTAAG